MKFLPSMCMDDISNRINFIIEREDLTQASFADLIGVNKATLNHILNGRNKPGLAIIQKIASEYPNYSLEWLINGTGDIFRKLNTQSSETSSSGTLLNDSLLSEKEREVLYKTAEDLDTLKTQLSVYLNELNKLNVEKRSSEEKERKITRIIVYYDDNSFQTFEN